ncbi:MAG: protein translocase subunit SecF [Rickettsiales bacterium]|jgi:preprotein translocase SecF subunit|nr:protein translocase subunit SecF [Rickettsiales bacterium]
MKLSFMKYRKLSYWISGILVALSILSFSVRGLNYGIDFAGGISMEVTPVSAEYTIDKMRGDLAAFGPELQSVDNKSILVRVGLPKGATDEQQNQRVREIKGMLGEKVSYSQVQIVGPKIGGELVRGGILAILVSFMLMSVYIWIRYKGGYAVGSFVSLVLDFVLMFGFFSITGLEFNQTSIAVILMGIGYSINDKVVNYDRIDENIKKYHKMPMSALIDLSINEMMRRTIMTSASTIVAMIGLYLFGGGMLRDFSVAMTFAVIMGTATSIYISNVVLYHFNLRETDY